MGKTLTVQQLEDASGILAPEGIYELAAEWYSGQFTALYALASTGSVELFSNDGLDPILSELRGVFSGATGEDANTALQFMCWLRIAGSYV